jgi:hypothetical protein
MYALGNSPRRRLPGQGRNRPFVAGLIKMVLLLPQGGEAIAELVQGAGDVAILGVAVELEALRALALEQRELDVVGQEKQLVRIGHGGRLRREDRNGISDGEKWWMGITWCGSTYSRVPRTRLVQGAKKAGGPVAPTGGVGRRGRRGAGSGETVVEERRATGW